MLQSLQEQLLLLNIKPSEKLLLAVSGGVDSMVLFDLFVRSGQKFALAHVNFSLRGKESDQDEALVKKAAQQKKVHCHTKLVDTQSYAKTHGLSIQLAAREIRYQWFASLKEEFGYISIVTAHHLEDSIETFFINLNRGTGLDGLSGIPSNHERFRPLLNFSKEEIRAYAKEQGVEHREDASNEDTKYERNWFRHEILSKWKSHNPSFLKNMATTLDRLATSKLALDQALHTDLMSLENEFSIGKIALHTVEQLQSKKLTFFQFLKTKGFSEDQVEKLLIGVQNKKVGSVFDSDQYSILIDREHLLIKEVETKAEERELFHIAENSNYLEHPMGLRLKEIDSGDFAYSVSRAVEGFDKEKLSFPLLLRKWKKGDKITPLGMKGQKKVSDILIDEKIPLFEKENVWVLCSKDEIIWLVGMKTSNRFKVDATTKKVLQIEWIK